MNVTVSLLEAANHSHSNIQCLESKKMAVSEEQTWETEAMSSSNPSLYKSVDVV